MTEENKKIEENYEEEFLKVYSKLPLKERDYPVVMLEGEPISWKMARREIQNRTKKGKKIAKKLKKLNII